MWPAEAYQFEWNVGKGLYYRDIIESNSTGMYPIKFFYGIIDEIKEGTFGGVRPLKYVDLDGKAPERDWIFGYTDTNGGRVIQGIGIPEWNDGECLFGPSNPNLAKTGAYSERHYRSMLVHFERDGEVLYDVWPKKEAIIEESVTFTKDQMATIILPTAPDASKGKYYRLDRIEDNQIVFEQEPQPKARVPYIIVPSEDFSIDLNDLDLEGLTKDSVSIEGVSFIGSYTSKELPALTGGDGGGSLYYDIIDKTPDCNLPSLAEAGKEAVIGALRAYLLVRWDDPIEHGETRSPKDRMNVVLIDEGSRIDGIENGGLEKGNEVYDLSGRKFINGKLSQGIYIVNRKKLVIPVK